MTMIVFDYADIRSRMLGEDKVAPKPRAESVLTVADLPPAPLAGWKPSPFYELVRRSGILESPPLFRRFIGIDTAKPGSDMTVLVPRIYSK